MRCELVTRDDPFAVLRDLIEQTEAAHDVSRFRNDGVAPEVFPVARFPP
jgi:hypothetical protein